MKPAVIVGIVVACIVVAGIGAYFMLKGPEGGEGAPQAGAVTLNLGGSATENSTALVWSPSTAADFVSYEIYQSTSSGVLGDQIATITDKTPPLMIPSHYLRVTDLSPNTTYYFTVRVNLAGGTYEDSDQVSVKTLQEGELKWTFEGQHVSGESSDPEVIQLSDGSYLMYLGSRIETSPDALTWTTIPEPSEQEFLPSGVSSYYLRDTFGGSIIELPDGRYRAYWHHNHDIMTAVSNDGRKWENEAVCTSPMEDFYGVHPSVIILPDETYQMYYSREFKTEIFTTPYGEMPVQRIYSAHSSDGLVWEPDPGIRMDGAEEVDRGHASSQDVYIREDGKYEMVYVSGYGGEIDWAVSDDGLNWTRMGYTGLEGVDPIINIFPGGTVRMYYAAGFVATSDKPVGIYSAIREPI